MYFNQYFRDSNASVNIVRSTIFIVLKTVGMVTFTIYYFSSISKSLNGIFSSSSRVLPKCEFSKLIIRYNIGPISAANSRLLLLSQCCRLHRSSAGPTTAAVFGCLNWPTFSPNLAQNRPYTKPIITFTVASSSESRRARVWLMDGILLGHVSLLTRQTILEVRKSEFGTASVRCCVENMCWWTEFGPE